MYGLSYDLFVLDLFANLVSIYCTINYRWSPLIRFQLSKRFPLFYPANESSAIPVSRSLLFKEFISLGACGLVLRQLLAYRSTKNVYQGVSTICTVLVALISSFAIFTYACSCYNLPVSDSGRFGVFYVEHVNYMWVIANIMQSTKYAPQLCLNWMGMCTKGVSSKFVLLSLFSECVVGLGSVTFYGGYEFYRKPFNFTPGFVTFGKVLCLLGILYQAQYVYLGKKPYVPRGK